MSRNMSKRLLLLCAVALFPAMAQAHQMNDGGGFLSGLAHPVLGFDHLLAMLSVGMLSAQMGGRAIWSVPATFVGVMLVGGVLGLEAVRLYSFEAGIALSVFALGVAVAAEKKLPTLLAMLFVGFFAIFHGYAHGIEMPNMASPVLYVSGFVTGTAGIHIAGVVFVLALKRLVNGGQLLRYIGAGIAGIGFHLLLPVGV